MTQFSKYHGLGNDFILVDCQQEGRSSLTRWKEWSAQVTRRGHSIGADGVLVATRNAEDGNLEMTVYNADGSQPEMCGNGLRCFVHFAVRELGETRDTFSVHTDAGLLETSWRAELKRERLQVTVNMGLPVLEPIDVPAVQVQNPTIHLLNNEPLAVHAVSMGNPHGVIFLDGAKPMSWMKETALALEGSGVFPEGVNTGFANVSGDRMSLVVHERGCGFTEACGTGACAAVVAAIQDGTLPREKWIEVSLPGGTLEIRWRGRGHSVEMTGPSEFVYAGQTPLT